MRGAHRAARSPAPREEAVQLAPVAAQRRIQNLRQAELAGFGHQMRHRRRQPRIARAGAFQHRWRAPRRSSRAPIWSSSTSKAGGMPASMGKRDSTIWQKACRVRTFRPPGVSSAAANSRRALRRSPWASPPMPAISRAQLVVGQHRPFAQLLEQPVLHLRRGRLGEGEAEDVLRLAPAPAAAAPRGWPAYRSCPTPALAATQAETSGSDAIMEASIAHASSAVADHSRTRARWS